jgi:hypothetical protein
MELSIKHVPSMLEVRGLIPQHHKKKKRRRKRKIKCGGFSLVS